MLEALIVLPPRFSRCRLAIAESQPSDRALRRFHLVFKLGLMRGVTLDPIPPGAVRLMVVEFVVDDFAHQLARGNRLRTARAVEGERSDQKPKHTHPVASEGRFWNQLEYGRNAVKEVQGFDEKPNKIGINPE